MQLNSLRPRWAGLAVIACASSAFAQTPAPTAAPSADDRIAVTRLEQRWLAAVQPGGDRRALRTILANDYIDTDWQGHMRDKQALIASPGAGNAIDHVTDLQVRVWGDTAVATGVNHVHSTSKGWTVDVPFTDVFARIDGHWRAVASQETLRKPATAPRSN